MSATIEGLNHHQNVLYRGGAQVAQWYCFPFGNNITPNGEEVAATFPNIGGEITAYSGTTRPALTFGAPAAGQSVVDDVVLTFTEAATVYGVAIVSAASKGSTSGILDNVIRFASPVSVSAGGTQTFSLNSIEIPTI